MTAQRKKGNKGNHKVGKKGSQKGKPSKLLKYIKQDESFLVELILLQTHNYNQKHLHIDYF